MSQGWFKLHRELYEKAIWQNSTPEQKVILITLLGMANHQGKEWEWKGKQFKAEPGQFVTSTESIIRRCGKGISAQNVKSAIAKFQKYDFLANESTNTGRLITIVNWGLYQGNFEESKQDINQQVINRPPSDNQEVAKELLTGHQQTTTNKNDNNIKKNNKVVNDEKEEEKELHAISVNCAEIESIIISAFSEITYNTWFSCCEMEIGEKEVKLKAPNNFTKNAIESKYKDKLKILVGKQIILE